MILDILTGIIITGFIVGYIYFLRKRVIELEKSNREFNEKFERVIENIRNYRDSNEKTFCKATKDK